MCVTDQSKWKYSNEISSANQLGNIFFLLRIMRLSENSYSYLTKKWYVEIQRILQNINTHHCNRDGKKITRPPGPDSDSTEAWI